MMKLLLTSSGISNLSIHGALVDLLGKPMAESNALFIPIGIYPFPRRARMAYQAICGKVAFSLCELGWKSLGVLELTALPGIEKKNWVSSIEEADALLVGGDPLYLSYWMSQSGLTELLPSLQRDLVYVGVSAGSMAVAPTFGETYHKLYRGTGSPLMLEDMVFATPHGEISMNFVTGKGAGFTNFALIPHANHKDRPDASFAGAEKCAKLPVPVYAIDDQTAIKVTDDTVDIISDGHLEAIYLVNSETLDSRDSWPEAESPEARITHTATLAVSLYRQLLGSGSQVITSPLQGTYSRFSVECKLHERLRLLTNN